MRTRQMLIEMVKRDRPEWSDKRCGKWLAFNLPKLKPAIRRRVGDLIREELMVESMGDE